MVFGIRRHLRSESFALSLRHHATPLAVATRALAYGTALCLGSFLLVGGSLSVCSGVYSLRRLNEILRTRLAPLRRPAPAESDEDALALADLLGEPNAVPATPAPKESKFEE